MDTRTSYDDLLHLYGPIAIVVFVLVCGAMVWCVVRYRDRPGAPPPSERHDAPRLEGAYVAVLMVIVAVLVIATFRQQHAASAPASPVGPQIGVVAAKWSWTFTYPGGVRIVSRGDRPRAAFVPAGQAVTFHLRSLDVIHAFWIPERRFQRQAFPGHDSVFALRFPKPGVYGGVCSFFCGLGHENMHFAIEALAPAAYTAWLRRAGTAARS